MSDFRYFRVRWRVEVRPEGPPGTDQTVEKTVCASIWAKSYDDAISILADKLSVELELADSTRDP